MGDVVKYCISTWSCPYIGIATTTLPSFEKYSMVFRQKRGRQVHINEGICEVFFAFFRMLSKLQSDIHFESMMFFKIVVAHAKLLAFSLDTM